jgi:hypothetical protein
LAGDYVYDAKLEVVDMMIRTFASHPTHLVDSRREEKERKAAKLLVNVKLHR